MRGLFNLAVGVLLAAAVVAASAQDTVTLKRVFKSGDVKHYLVEVTMTPEDGSGDPDLQMAIRSEDKVVKVGSDGSAVVDSKQLSMKMIYNGQELPDMGGQELVETTTYGPDNSIKKLESDSPGIDFSKRLALAMTPVFPKNPMKVGDTVEYKLKADEEAGWRGGSATLKLLAIETVGGVKCAKLSHTFTEEPFAGDEGKISTSSTMWVALDTGYTIKAEGTGKGLLLPGTGAAGALQITYKVQMEQAK
jgi:hypothetical protein